MENITKKKIIFSIITLALTGFYFSHWFSCLLDSRFFFSHADTTLKIIFDIRGDYGIPSWQAHVLHNKITQSSIDVFNAYFYFWDISFLLLLISPLTLLGLILRLYYFIQKREVAIFEKIYLVFALLMPCFIMFSKTNRIFLFIFALSLFFLSLRGIFLSIKHNKHHMLLLLLAIVISLWYLPILNTAILHFCHL